MSLAQTIVLRRVQGAGLLPAAFSELAARTLGRGFRIDRRNRTICVKSCVQIHTVSLRRYIPQPDLNRPNNPAKLGAGLRADLLLRIAV
jgi:hypothetical protein